MKSKKLSLTLALIAASLSLAACGGSDSEVAEKPANENIQVGKPVEAPAEKPNVPEPVEALQPTEEAKEPVKDEPKTEEPKQPAEDVKEKEPKAPPAEEAKTDEPKAPAVEETKPVGNTSEDGGTDGSATGNATDTGNSDANSSQGSKDESKDESKEDAGEKITYSVTLKDFIPEDGFVWIGKCNATDKQTSSGEKIHTQTYFGFENEKEIYIGETTYTDSNCQIPLNEEGYIDGTIASEGIIILNDGTQALKLLFTPAEEKYKDEMKKMIMRLNTKDVKLEVKSDSKEYPTDFLEPEIYSKSKFTD